MLRRATANATKVVSKVHNEPKMLYGTGGVAAYMTKATANTNSTVRLYSAKTGPITTASKRSFGAYVLLVVPVTTFGIGTARLRKSQCRSEYVQKMNERLLQPPTELPDNLEELNKDLDRRRFVLRGTFDHKNEIAVSVGPPWRKASSKAEASTSDPKKPEADSKCGKGGYEVIVPFKLANKDLTILVNRGWIPEEKLKPDTRRSSQVEGKVEVVGIYRDQKHKFPFEGKCKTLEKKIEKTAEEATKVDGGIWRWKHVELMAKKLNASPLLFEVTADSSADGGPVGAPLQLKEKSYKPSIVTFYAISLVTSLLWYGKYIRAP